MTPEEVWLLCMADVPLTVCLIEIRCYSITCEVEANGLE
jgi:hypothetical protein